MSIRLTVSLTAQGTPAIWQQGGGTRDYGEALVIGDQHAKPKKAIEIRRNADHNHQVLIPISTGDTVLHTTKVKGKLKEKVYIVHTDGQKTTLSLYNERNHGKWRIPTTPKAERQLGRIMTTAATNAGTAPHRAEFFIDR